MMLTIKDKWISFGGNAAIVTSSSLILGMDAASSSSQSIVSAILMFALADNLTDSLSVHTYQEAERLESREAFLSTIANFVTRLFVALTFIVLVIALPRNWLAITAGVWGLLLLVLLTWRLAHARGANIMKEICKHIGVAIIVIGLSRSLGAWVAETFS